MSRLEELIQQLCPDGVEWKKLGDICDVFDGTHQTPQYTESGIKFVSVENINAPYSSNKFISLEDYNSKYKTKPQKNDVLMTRIGDVGTCYVLDSDEPIAYYVSLTLLRPNNVFVLSKYIKHIIESKTGKEELRKRTLLTAVPLKINLGEISKIQIPIPPLPVQEEIVRILDTFTGSIANLKGQIQTRRKQYEYYRDQLLDLDGKEGVEMKTLGDMCVLGTGSHNTQDGLSEGQYPFYTRGSEILYLNNFDYDETAIITAGDGAGVGKVFHYVQGKYALHQRAYRIVPDEKKVLARFVYYYIEATFYNYIMRNSVSSSVVSIRRPMMVNYPVPRPSLAEQQRIVDILDQFEASMANLEAQLKQREKQYEYYRNRLLDFKKKEV